MDDCHFKRARVDIYNLPIRIRSNSIGIRMVLLQNSSNFKLIIWFNFSSLSNAEINYMKVTIEYL